MTRAFPAFFPLEDRLVVVAGGGVVAARKGRLAARFGARLRFVSPTIDPALVQEFPLAAFVTAPVEPENLKDAALVFAAAENRASDAATATIAADLRIPVNAVDQPDISAFICPAVIDRGEVVVAVSTGGASPVLARRIRRWIEAALPEGLARLVRFAAQNRKRLRPHLRSVDASRRFWETALDGAIGELVLDGRMEEARRALDHLAIDAADHMPRGEIHLVGAGPGDPDLLTVKALRLLGDADIVFYDRLVGDAVLDRIRRDADLVYVGKAPGAHAMPQAEIERRMVAEALRGRRVVRLKGGDPSLFARGGEEIDAARAAGIPVFIVPGISASLAAAAAAAIPLTDRRTGSGVSFISGHDADAIAAAALYRLGHTIVVYMGRESAGPLAARLIGGGFAATLPVAIVENASRRDQRVFKSSLADLAATLKREKIRSPTLLIVGAVAAGAEARSASEALEAAA